MYQRPRKPRKQQQSVPPHSPKKTKGKKQPLVGARKEQSTRPQYMTSRNYNYNLRTHNSNETKTLQYTSGHGQNKRDLF